MIFYIADMHFGHENVLRFDDRPFSEIGQMDETAHPELECSRRRR